MELIRIAWWRVFSWGIRMELRRIAMRAPCHPREGSLHLAHANGPPCNIAPSTLRNPDSLVRSMSSGGGVPTPCTRRRSPLRHSLFHPGEEFYPAEVPPSPDISYPDISQPDGRGGRFNFPDQTCLDPLIGYLTSG